MRLFCGSGLVIIAFAALGSIGLGACPALAQSSSVKSTFEKHQLLGTFAYDCSKPMGKGNFYFAAWARDDGHVQRDQMSSLKPPFVSTVFDQAVELAPDKLSATGTNNGVRSEVVWQLDKNRTHAIEYTLGGKKVVTGGKFVSNGLEVPWLNKCEVPATLTESSLGGPDSVRTIFEKHNLLGTYAQDCSKPPKAEENWYYVDRLIDAGRVQRDLMESKTKRTWSSIIDQAFEQIPNQIFVKGTRDDKPSAALWKLDNNRMVQWEAIDDGQPTISGGKWLKTSAAMPWISRCGDADRIATNAYFFKAGQYVRYDIPGGKVANGYPQPLDGQHWANWPAGWDSGINTAIDLGNGKAYFFKGSNYIRYDIASAKVDDGYPQPIARYWHGFPDAWYSGFDAAINWGNGKAYFFKGSQYVSYDIAGAKVDDGFPKAIAGNWPQWPAAWNSGINAAVNWGDGKAYFFKGDQYLRYDIRANTVDQGYPRPIAGAWAGLTKVLASGFDAVIAPGL